MVCETNLLIRISCLALFKLLNKAIMKKCNIRNELNTIGVIKRTRKKLFQKNQLFISLQRHQTPKITYEVVSQDTEKDRTFLKYEK